MKKSKKKFIMFAILSVLLMANMKNVNAGQVQKNDKSVAIEELGGYLSGVDCQKNDKVEISQSFNVENSKNKSSIFFVKVAVYKKSCNEVFGNDYFSIDSCF